MKKGVMSKKWTFNIKDGTYFMGDRIDQDVVIAKTQEKAEEIMETEYNLKKLDYSLISVEDIELGGCINELKVSDGDSLMTTLIALSE